MKFILLRWQTREHLSCTKWVYYMLPFVFQFSDLRSCFKVFQFVLQFKYIARNKASCISDSYKENITASSMHTMRPNVHFSEGAEAENKSNIVTNYKVPDHLLTFYSITQWSK